MKLITSTKFRKDVSTVLDEVEAGATLIIVRHGKPIAELIPYSGAKKSTSAWQKPGLRLQIDGASLSTAILDEREESP